MEQQKKRQGTQKATVQKSKQPPKKSGAVTVHDSANVDTASSVGSVAVDFSSTSFVSIGGYSYIPFFAPNDDQFRLFLTARLLSPTQGSCLDDKTLYSIGSGLQVQDQEFPKEFDRKINRERHTIDDILKLAFSAYWQDGNVFIEVVRQEVAGARYIHVNLLNNLDCRFEENLYGPPTHILRSREFRREGVVMDTKNAIRTPLWTDLPISEDEIWAKDEGKPNVQRTVLHIKHEWAGVDAYGLPSNYPGMQQVLLEYKASKFNLDNFENNMFLGGALAIEGSVNPTEEKKLMKGIRSMHIGDGKAQRVMVISSESGLTGTKFLPFNDPKEGHFIELDKRIEEKIIGANNWSKELLDLKSQSGLGKGGDYLKSLFKYKHKTIINPAQDLMMWNFVWPLMQIIDEWKGTNFSTLPWYIKPNIPLSFEGELDINSLLSVDEGREEIGKLPIGGDKGNLRISEVKTAKGGQANDQP